MALENITVTIIVCVFLGAPTLLGVLGWSGCDGGGGLGDWGDEVDGKRRLECMEGIYCANVDAVCGCPRLPFASFLRSSVVNMPRLRFLLSCLFLLSSLSTYLCEFDESQDIV